MSSRGSMNEKRHNTISHDMRSPMHTTSVFTVNRGIKCTLHTYRPYNPSRGIVVFYHSLNSHGTFPPIRYPALLLSSAGYKVYILDLPTHGRCPTAEGGKWNRPIYFENVEAVLDDAISIARKAAIEAVESGRRFYLGGASMGGAIALLVADRHYNRRIRKLSINPTGLFLLAPMLSLRGMPGTVIRNILSGVVVSGAGKWAAIPATYPQGKDNKILRRILPDEIRREECDKDPDVHRGNSMRLGTAKSLLDMVELCERSIHGKNSNDCNFFDSGCQDDVTCYSTKTLDDTCDSIKTSDSISCAILCCIASRDETVSNSGAMALCGVGGVLGGKLKNRTLTAYPAVHNIFCDKEEVRGNCERDILRWFEFTHRV